MGTENIPSHTLSEQQRLQVLLRQADDEAKVAVRKLGQEEQAKPYWAAVIGRLTVQFTVLVPQLLDILEAESAPPVPGEQLETPQA